jgi:hypothetical protein
MSLRLRYRLLARFHQCHNALAHSARCLLLLLLLLLLLAAWLLAASTARPLAALWPAQGCTVCILPLGFLS